MQSYDDEFLDEIFETTKQKKSSLRNDAIFDSMDFLDESENDKIKDKKIKKFDKKDDKFFEINPSNSQIPKKEKKRFLSFFSKKDKFANLEISPQIKEKKETNDIKIENFQETNLQKEKEEILQNYDFELLKEKNLTIYHFLYVYLAVAIFLATTLPFLYVKNEIYYISREISTLRNEHEVLLEENKNLKTNIELIRYKHEIQDNFDIKIE